MGDAYAATPMHAWDTMVEGRDMLSWQKGRHSFKFGGSYRHYIWPMWGFFQNRGYYQFTNGFTTQTATNDGTGSALASFLLGLPAVAQRQAGIPQMDLVNYSWDGFIHDTFLLTRNTTINIGLRYDYQQPPYERNCGTSNFNPSVKDPNTGLLGDMQYACKGYGKTFLNSDYKNFAPRFGFAYDVSGNGETVIRGGYAIFYPSIFNLNYFGNTQGFATTSTSYNPPGNNTNLPAFLLKDGFPTPPIQPLGSALGTSFLLGQGVSYDQPNQKTPMSQQWDISVQKQLPGKWVIDLAYAGNRGTRLVAGSYNLDQLNLQYLSNGTALQNPVTNPYSAVVPGSLGSSTIPLQQSLLPYPYYTGVTVRNPHLGNAMYHAGMLTVIHRITDRKSTRLNSSH